MLIDNASTAQGHHGVMNAYSLICDGAHALQSLTARNHGGARASCCPIVQDQKDANGRMLSDLQ
eukprot:1154607-Pelagomonas_calceolata.AAC.9